MFAHYNYIGGASNLANKGIVLDPWTQNDKQK
jgi:hypothetical protein